MMTVKIPFVCQRIGVDEVEICHGKYGLGALYHERVGAVREPSAEPIPNTISKTIVGVAGAMRETPLGGSGYYSLGLLVRAGVHSPQHKCRRRYSVRRTFPVGDHRSRVLRFGPRPPFAVGHLDTQGSPMELDGSLVLYDWVAVAGTAGSLFSQPLSLTTSFYRGPED